MQHPEPIFPQGSGASSAQGSFSAGFLFFYVLFFWANLGDSMHPLGKHEVSGTCKNQ